MRRTIILLFVSILSLAPLWGKGTAEPGERGLERTLLIGPKTIGRAWRDNILVEPQQFQSVQPGDLINVYTQSYKRGAQIAFQCPKDWQAVSPEYGCLGIEDVARMTVTDSILAKIQQYGLLLCGHDYVIAYVTHVPASAIERKTLWKGPATYMPSDWSVSAEIQRKIFDDLQVGDALHFEVKNTKPGAAIKLMDLSYHPLSKAVDGCQIGEQGFTYSITSQDQLVQLRLAGADGISLRVGGCNYTLARITRVRYLCTPNPDITTAQRAPREYQLAPGELFHGEKAFPQDWSGNLSLTAAPFQESGADDVLVVSYRLTEGEKHQLSFRNNSWSELSGADEPIWYFLDGNDIVLPLDNPIALDAVKTKGLVLTGVGFTLTKIELIHVE